MKKAGNTRNWIWGLVIAALLIVIIVWVASPAADGDDPAVDQSELASPEPAYTVAPEGAVPVDVPESTVTAVPIESQNSGTAPPE